MKISNAKFKTLLSTSVYIIIIIMCPLSSCSHALAFLGITACPILELLQFLQHILGAVVKHTISTWLLVIGNNKLFILVYYCFVPCRSILFADSETTCLLMWINIFGQFSRNVVPFNTIFVSNGEI